MSRPYRFALSLLAGAIVLVGTLPSPSAVRAAPGVDMVVEKEASVSEVPVDGLITYTITARNVGTAWADGVRVRDTRIDRELIITAGPTTTNGLSCRIDATNNLFCHKRFLAPGGQVSVTFTAQAPVEACVLIRNRAETEANNEPAANATNNFSDYVAVRMTGCPPDTTPPTGSVVINHGQPIAWGPRVILGLNVSDDRTGDTSILMRVTNAFQNGALVHPYSAGYVRSLRWSLTNPLRGGTAATGLKTVYARYRDRAGNWSPIVNDTIQMRTDAPNSCTVAAARPRRSANITFHDTIFPAGDIDWFKFQLSSRRAVAITLSQLPANYTLALAGGRCGIVAAADHLGMQNEVIRRTIGPGTFFVRVKAARLTTESVRPYSIRFDTTP